MPKVAISIDSTMSQLTSVTFSDPLPKLPSVIFQENGGNGSRFYRYRIAGCTRTGFEFWLVSNSTITGSAYVPP